MKRFEHAIIIIGGCLVAFGLIFAVLNNEAKRIKKEQERRSEMYLILEDDESK
jgi:hypothetical protein